MTFETKNSGKLLMLESADCKIRYDFYTKPIYNSNIDRSVAYYKPCICFHQLLTGGSTAYEEFTSIEEGNAFFKKLLSEGFKRVTFKTRSFA